MAQDARGRKMGDAVGAEGAPNLHQVDKNFFRSAQPDATGFVFAHARHAHRHQPARLQFR
jgi:hypothetical protein